MNHDKSREVTNLEDSLLEDSELDAARGGVEFAQLLASRGSARFAVTPSQLDQLQVLRPLRPLGTNASYIKEIITDKPGFDAAVLTRATNLLAR
jgi:hypothetical protein